MTVNATGHAPSPARRRLVPRLKIPFLKRLLPRTLFGRSLMIVVTPIIVVQVVITVYFYDNYVNRVMSHLARSVGGDVAYLVSYVERERDLERRAMAFTEASQHMRLLVSFEPGATVIQQPPPSPFRRVDWHLNATLAQSLTQPYSFEMDLAERWVSIRVQVTGGVLDMLMPVRRVYLATSHQLFLWMVGSALVVATVALLFMRNQVRPIRRLAQAAEDFGRGIDVGRFKPEGAAEVRQAGRAFQQMRDRIQRQITQRVEMLAGVSHDLRTPMTRMKLQLALLGDGPDIEELKRDVAEMEQMIEGYLAFARGEEAEEIETRALADLLLAAVGDARRAGAVITAPELEVTDVPDRDLGPAVAVRPRAFRRCLDNLIANARRHAGRMWLSGQIDGDMAVIRIDDDGPGIPPDRHEEVFRPFRRLEPSRNRDTGGTGLGLTIARDIARGHGGDITLGTSPQGGLRAEVRVPVTDPSSAG